MDPLCEHCGAQRALVYCEPDAARLCLPCDLHVHAANALSRRHLRSLLCGRCAAGPAVVRHADRREGAPSPSLLCAACLQDVGGGGASPVIRYHPVSCSYSGCPATAELSRILAAGRDGNIGDGNDDGAGNGNDDDDGNGMMMMMMMNVMGMMASIDDNCSVVGDMDPAATWMGSDSGLLEQLHKDHPTTTSAALCCPPLRDNNGICDDNGFRDDFNPGNSAHNVDNIELFGSMQPKYPYQDGGLDGYFVDTNYSAVDSDVAIEVSSSIQLDDMNLPSSQSLHGVNNNNPDQMLLNLQSNGNFSFRFPPGNVCPSMSLSLSNLTGESSVADYQDCGVSPMFLNVKLPWDPNLEISRPQARKEAKMRYDEKKKSRMFGKQIRYASRKARADTRKRVRGRFVKAGEAYDYDPLCSKK